MQKKDDVDKEIVRVWGVKLAEEIEKYTHNGLNSQKLSYLEDALEEAHIVLEMADEKDLARKALELSAKVSEARLILRSTRIISPSIEKIRLDSQKFAREMKKRLVRKLEVDAATH